jgi:hypothetical protein
MEALFMPQSTLQRCKNGCCLFVDGKPVTKEEYDKAAQAHPGSYAGISGQRNAIVHHGIACRAVPAKP